MPDFSHLPQRDVQYHHQKEAHEEAARPPPSARARKKLLRHDVEHRPRCKAQKPRHQRVDSRRREHDERAEQRLPAGLGTLFAGLLLVVLAFVEGDSAWKALHDVLFGLFGCGSFVLGAAVCCLAVQYTRGEDLLPPIFKLILGLVFACGTVIVFSDIQPQGMSAFQMTAACYANGVNAWLGGGALGALLGGNLLLLCGRPALGAGGKCLFILLLRCCEVSLFRNQAVIPFLHR